MSAETDSGLSVSPLDGGAPFVESPRRRIRPLWLAYGLVFAAFGALVGAIAIVGSPTDGNPEISIAIKGATSEEKITSSKPGAFRNGKEIDGHWVADPDLIEDSPQGPLPKIARDGRLPMAIYGTHADLNDKRPKIALVIRGLGVGTNSTEQALSQLSYLTTLAFAPFAADLQKMIDKARGAGHEVLLQVPMEPFDFPDSDPGPHALLVASSEEENGKRLEWTLSRATGYVGVTNLLGGRFLAESNAIEPVLDRLTRRGLMFFDDGASSSTAISAGARKAKAMTVTGTLVLDQVQTQPAIDTKLAELEAAARQEGSAIGVASAYPVSIARVSEWLANAEARGFQIVPLTALARRPSAEAVAHADVSEHQE